MRPAQGAVLPHKIFAARQRNCALVEIRFRIISNRCGNASGWRFGVSYRFRIADANSAVPMRAKGPLSIQPDRPLDEGIARQELAAR